MKQTTSTNTQFCQNEERIKKITKNMNRLIKSMYMFYPKKETRFMLGNIVLT